MDTINIFIRIEMRSKLSHRLFIAVCFLFHDTINPKTVHTKTNIPKGDKTNQKDRYGLLQYWRIRGTITTICVHATYTLYYFYQIFSQGNHLPYFQYHPSQRQLPPVGGICTLTNCPFSPLGGVWVPGGATSQWWYKSDRPVRRVT